MTNNETTGCPVCGSSDFSTIYDSPVASVKFLSAFKTPIMNEEKTLTIRHNLSDEIDIGDTVAFIDSDGNEFAWAKVLSRAQMTAKAIVESEFSGHRNYSDMRNFALSMREFYPDSYFGPDTMMDIIWFNVIMAVDHKSDEKEVIA